MLIRGELRDSEPLQIHEIGHESSLWERASNAARGQPTLSFEDYDMPEDYSERRKYLRVEVHLDKLEVTVGVLGIEPTNGVVLNISRGGMKVCLEREIAESLVGDDCLVRFVEDPQDRVSVKVKLGKVLRTETAGQYAIEFDSPLESAAGGERRAGHSGS